MSKTNIMEITPSKNIIVIRPTEIPSSTRVIPLTSDAPRVGEIIAIGNSKNPPIFKIGDIIAYRQFGEYEFFINGETLYFVKFDDILGLIKPKKNCCRD